MEDENEEKDIMIIFKSTNKTLNIPFPYVISPFSEYYEMAAMLYKLANLQFVIENIIKRSGYVYFLLFIRNIFK